MLQKLQTTIFVFTALLMCWGLSPQANASNGPLQPVIEQALRQNLDQHPYWFKLLKYQYPLQSVFQWGHNSDVVTADFFLSETGHKDPRAELIATLTAFAQPATENPDQHPQCRWRARYYWLQEQLQFDPQTIEPRECPWYDRWSNHEKIESISLIFASTFYNNPASLFGHQLLKINFSEGIFSHSLLSPTLNYGAQVDKDHNPLEYAVRGLLGGYLGRFSDERFYNFNHVYGETELRDLWEYQLNLTQKQKRRVVAHTWEMLQNTAFTYYFFRDNCAYRMTELLDMAWDDRRLLPYYSMWALPVSPFFRLEDIQTEGQPLVADIRLIPSRQRRLLWKVENLNSSERQWASTIVQQQEKMNSQEFQRLEEDSQARVLDVVIDHRQYSKVKHDLEVNEAERHQLLLKRSKLPIIEDTAPASVEEPPTQGNPPVRTNLGWVHNQDHGGSPEVGIWPAYRDLLDRETGHIPNNHLKVMDLQFRKHQTAWYLHRVTLAEIISLVVSPSGLPTDYSYSWKARLGLQPPELKCQACRVFVVDGGMGFAQELRSGLSGTLYSFLNITTQVAERFKQGQRTGLRPEAGILLRPNEDWKLELQASRFFPIVGEMDYWNQALLRARYTLKPQWEMRMKLMWQRGTEGSLGIHYFW